MTVEETEGYYFFPPTLLSSGRDFSEVKERKNSPWFLFPPRRRRWREKKTILAPLCDDKKAPGGALVEPLTTERPSSPPFPPPSVSDPPSGLSIVHFNYLLFAKGGCARFLFSAACQREMSHHSSHPVCGAIGFAILIGSDK